MLKNYSALLMLTVLAFLVVSSLSYGQDCNIYQIDFLNHSYPLPDCNTSEEIVFVNGKMTQSIGLDIPSLESSIYPVQYGDLDNDCQEEALIAIDVPTWGSDIAHLYVYIIKCIGNREAIVYIDDYEQGESAVIKDNGVYIKGPYWLDDDAHCCPTFSATFVVRYICNEFKKDDLLLVKNAQWWQCP
jgi:hypothetical protein